MYLFFDTETNGLPKNMAADHKDVDNWPRIIQLAYILYDKDFNEIERYCELITPDGWEIPALKFWIDNGYSTEKNSKEGVPMRDALINLATCIERCQIAVAHNMSFDLPIIGAEMVRYGIAPINRPKKICTMRSTTDFVQAKNSRGGLKWPRLEELHTRLFGVNFDNAHDALADVTATARCFRELVKLGILTV
jgi:DNA polymerase III epsilon subunit-like protein